MTSPANNSRNARGLRPTARAIIIHDGAILLMERWRAGQHYFSIPGGGIEPGETAEQAALRELLEETSVHATDLRLVYQLVMGGADHTFFAARYVSGEAGLPPDSEEALHQDADNRFLVRWVPCSDIVSLPFGVWEPLRTQLVHDAQSGFTPGVRMFHATLVGK